MPVEVVGTGAVRIRDNGCITSHHTCVDHHLVSVLEHSLDVVSVGLNPIVGERPVNGEVADRPRLVNPQMLLHVREIQVVRFRGEVVTCTTQLSDNPLKLLTNVHRGNSGGQESLRS